MAKLGRMELAALKRMEKSLKPLERQLLKLDTKLKALYTERKEVAEQYERMETVMNTYAGVDDYKTILYPEEVEITAEIEGELDDTDTAEFNLAEIDLREEMSNEVSNEEAPIWDLTDANEVSITQ